MQEIAEKMQALISSTEIPAKLFLAIKKSLNTAFTPQATDNMRPRAVQSREALLTVDNDMFLQDPIELVLQLEEIHLF